MPGADESDQRLERGRSDVTTQRSGERPALQREIETNRCVPAQPRTPPRQCTADGDSVDSRADDPEQFTMRRPAPAADAGPDRAGV